MGEAIDDQFRITSDWDQLKGLLLATTLVIIDLSAGIESVYNNAAPLQMGMDSVHW